MAGSGPGVGTAMKGVGVGLQVYSQYQADKAEAEAELENALWLDEQAAFAQEAAEREATIFGRESEMLIGEQVGGFAKAGVEMSGSALDVIGESKALANMELEAIIKAGEFKVREATLKAGASRKRAEQLSDPTSQLLKAGGTILTGMS